MNKVPSWHEWENIGPKLWRCPWCDGFYRSEKMPDREAVANSLQGLGFPDCVAAEQEGNNGK